MVLGLSLTTVRGISGGKSERSSWAVYSSPQRLNDEKFDNTHRRCLLPGNDVGRPEKKDRGRGKKGWQRVAAPGFSTQTQRSKRQSPALVGRSQGKYTGLR